MKTWSILAVTPTTDAWVADYLPTANRLVAAHGGRYVARTTDHQQVEGDPDPATLRILIEWPSKEAALAFMADPAYQPHLQARTAGSRSLHYLVAERDELG